MTPTRGSDPTRTGRRAAAASRRPSMLTVVSAVIPLLTVGALALVRPVPIETAAREASPMTLDRSTVVCPSGTARLLREPGLVVADAEGGSGEVQLLQDGEESPLEVSGATREDASSAVSVRASGELAPGLAAARVGERVAGACQRPEPERWFGGVGGSPEHSSVLELVNPDAGPAVADIEVHGPDGIVDAPRLRGVTVAARDSLTLDLADLLPTRDELSLHVSVSRGRLGTFLLDEVDQLGRGANAADWLAPQGAPATTSHLLGLGERGGERTLVVTNTSENEARVQLKLVTADSEFTPAEAEELRVAPGGVETVDVSDLLGGRAAKDALGVVLTSSEPVLGTLRTVAADDLTHTVALGALTQRSFTVLPEGDRRLVLGGAARESTVTWTAYDAKGKEVDSKKVDLAPGHAAAVDLPASAALLDVRVEGAGVLGAVEGATAKGRATVPLVELVTSSLVPDVRPAHSSSTR
ncbi:MAG: DUF5719 family protein [Nocardioides sp.]|uniref:DUF5719 family protein n=1 Tax=Nocardioides sp. TaxID=35761 RepID=UPI003F0494EF